MNCCDYECNQGRDCPARSVMASPNQMGQGCQVGKSQAAAALHNVPLITKLCNELGKFSRFIGLGLLGVLIWSGMIYAVAKAAPSISTYECSKATAQSVTKPNQKCREK